MLTIRAGPVYNVSFSRASFFAKRFFGLSNKEGKVARFIKVSLV